MPPSDVYVCDADCLINVYRHFGRKAISALRRYGKTSRLKLPEGVLREIIRGTDKLASFAKTEWKTVGVEIGNDSRLSAETARLENLYGQKIRIGTREYIGFWHSAAGRKAADAEVVAVAKLLIGTVVSDDRAVELACACEGVPCIGWSEFARRVGLVEPEQLNLNLGDAGGSA